LTAFFAAAFGDAWEPVKHQFLFNLLLDTCLVFGLAALPHVLRPGGSPPIRKIA
jgi:Na+(H+)/acetate symporter ActP